MTYIYKIKGTNAELIDKTEAYDSLITSDTFPAREYHENTHAILSYSEDKGVYWKYVPYSAAELREQAYETEKLIEWDGNMLTVDEANKMFLRYDAEGYTEKSAALTTLIAHAKAEIRERYADVAET